MSNYECRSVSSKRMGATPWPPGCSARQWRTLIRWSLPPAVSHLGGTLGCMQRSAAMRRLRKRDRAAPAAPAAPVTRNKVLKQLQLVLDEASVKHCEPVNIFTLASAFTRKT